MDRDEIIASQTLTVRAVQCESYSRLIPLHWQTAFSRKPWLEHTDMLSSDGGGAVFLNGYLLDMQRGVNGGSFPEVHVFSCSVSMQSWGYFANSLHQIHSRV